MSALATEAAPVQVSTAPARATRRLFEPPGREATLEDRILGVWEDLTARGEAACPVCGGHLRAERACPDCGSHLT